LLSDSGVPRLQCLSDYSAIQFDREFVALSERRGSFSLTILDPAAKENVTIVTRSSGALGLV
jgi:hypothetical protein